MSSALQKTIILVICFQNLQNSYYGDYDNYIIIHILKQQALNVTMSPNLRQSAQKMHFSKSVSYNCDREAVIYGLICYIKYKNIYLRS